LAAGIAEIPEDPVKMSRKIRSPDDPGDLFVRQAKLQALEDSNGLREEFLRRLKTKASLHFTKVASWSL